MSTESNSSEEIECTFNIQLNHIFPRKLNQQKILPTNQESRFLLYLGDSIVYNNLVIADYLLTITRI